MVGMGRRLPPDRRLGELEAIYRDHHRRVRWVLRARAVADAELDDLMHDAFLAIFARLGDRDPELPLGQWVAGVARNVAFTHRRTAARRRRAAPPPPPVPELDPDEQLARRRAWDRLEDFLHSLDPSQREVFVLADVMGMRMPEVATMVDAPLNTLYSRLRIARRRFSDRFGAAAEDALRDAVAADTPRRAEQQHAWLLLAAKLAPGAAPLVASSMLGAAFVKWALVGTLAIGVVAVIALEPSPAPTPVHVMPPADSVEPTRSAVASATVPAVVPVVSAQPPVVPTASTPAPPRRAERGPVEDAPGDELAGVVDALRRAKQHVTAGEHAIALGVLDGLPPAAKDGPLGAELRKLERTAACGAGRRDRCPSENPPAP